MIADFNDDYLGAAPDRKAAEAGAPAMVFGVSSRVRSAVLAGGTTGGPSPTESPYSDTAIALSASFEAENFDLGGQNVAYLGSAVLQPEFGERDRVHLQDEEQVPIAESPAGPHGWVFSYDTSSERARMAKQVDARDLKSLAAKAACRFESGSGHQCLRVNLPLPMGRFSTCSG